MTQIHFEISDNYILQFETMQAFLVSSVCLFWIRYLTMRKRLMTTEVDLAVTQLIIIPAVCVFTIYYIPGSDEPTEPGRG